MVSIAPPRSKAPLCKGPARERCLWQSSDPSLPLVTKGRCHGKAVTEGMRTGDSRRTRGKRIPFAAG